MSLESGINQAVATDDGGGSPPPQSPTTTYYQSVATNFLKEFEQLASLVPKLELSHPATSEFVRTHTNVPVAFLATTVASVEQEPDLQAVSRMDVALSRDRLQYWDAFRPVRDRVATFLDAIGFSLNTQRAYLTVDSLQMYEIAKGMARDPGSAHISAVVGNMKRDLKRKGSKKSSESSSSPPVVTAQ